MNAISILKNRLAVLREGSVFGGIMLISGSCIGVGMLALPVLTASAGFVPTLIIFILSGLFMATTALLLLEAHLWFPEKSNFISLSERILGLPGKIFTWVSFTTLFYSLVVAYIVKGGDLLQQGLVSMGIFSSLPAWTGPSLITLLSFATVYFGTGIVDRFNRFCMIGLFLTYIYLLSVGLSYSEPKHLTHVDWSYTLFILPFVVTTFGYHNMIPSINTYLGGDRKKMVPTVMCGAIIPFAVFLLWILKIQSVVPLDGPAGLRASFEQGAISTEALAKIVPSSWIGITANYFAFFAIITSLFGQSLSVCHFLADGLKIQKSPIGRLLLCGLTFIPAFFCARCFPNIFFLALEFVGGISAMLIFGILPVLLVWKGRYKMKINAKPLVPGGKIVLLFIGMCALSIFTYEAIKLISSHL